MANSHLGCLQQIIFGLLGKLYAKYLLSGVTQEKWYTLPFLDVCEYSQTKLSGVESEKKFKSLEHLNKCGIQAFRLEVPWSSSISGYWDDQRNRGVNIQSLTYSSGCPFPSPSGWKHFLHRLTLVPELTAIGSYQFLQIHIYFSFLGLEWGWLWEGKVRSI